MASSSVSSIQSSFDARDMIDQVETMRLPARWLCCETSCKTRQGKKRFARNGDRKTGRLLSKGLVLVGEVTAVIPFMKDQSYLIVKQALRSIIRSRSLRCPIVSSRYGQPGAAWWTIGYAD